MEKLFNDILVPARLNRSQEPAIERALHIANHFRCNLHILQLAGSAFLAKEESSRVTNEKRSTYLRERYGVHLQPGLQLHVSLCKGITSRTIAEYAIQHHIDLVVLGNQPSPGNLFRYINVNRLSRKIGCPVLTVRTRPVLEKIQNIVLPVNTHLPIRKIMFASYLAKRFNSRIHLIALNKHQLHGDSENTAYLYKSYQLLRDNTNLVIECHTVKGDNITDTTVEYAQQINADLILVNPGKESMLPGLANRLFPRSIFHKCRIPVMTITPLLTK